MCGADLSDIDEQKPEEKESKARKKAGQNSEQIERRTRWTKNRANKEQTEYQTRTQKGNLQLPAFLLFWATGVTN